MLCQNDEISLFCSYPSSFPFPSYRSYPCLMHNITYSARGVSHPYTFHSSVIAAAHESLSKSNSRVSLVGKRGKSKQDDFAGGKTTWAEFSHSNSGENGN